MSSKCLWASYGKMSEKIWKAGLGKYVEYSRLLSFFTPTYALSHTTMY
jgi:hypothetical protein